MKEIWNRASHFVTENERGQGVGTISKEYNKLNNMKWKVQNTTAGVPSKY